MTERLVALCRALVQDRVDMANLEKVLRDNPWLTGTQLRDLFALAVVQGIYAYGDTVTTTDEADVVWQVADLMVSRREVVQPPLG